MIEHVWGGLRENKQLGKGEGVRTHDRLRIELRFRIWATRVAIAAYRFSELKYRAC
jgi:hypothetical protein